MKTSYLYAALAASTLLWSCQEDKLAELGSSQTHQLSAARLAAEVKPTKQWDATFGGPGRNELTTAVNYQYGNVILGGYADSKGGDKAIAYGGFDYFLVNVRPDGTKQGHQTVGGSGDDVLSSLLALPDNSLLLGGYSNSPSNSYKSSPSKGLRDFWVVKLSVRGNKEWDRTIGGIGDEALSSMIATADGGFLLGGHSTSPAGGDKSKASLMGSYDYWIVKLDAKGNKQWDKTFGAGGSDYLTSLVATPDGGYLLAGTSSSTGEEGGDKTQPCKGLNDFWVVKIDGNGNKLWDKVYGSSDDDRLAAAIATTDGGFMLGASVKGIADGDITVPAYGRSAYWVLKLDANGNLQWDKMLNTKGLYHLYSLLATPDGGAVLGGDAYSWGQYDKSERFIGSSWDFWVVKLDAGGRKVWDKTLGGTESDAVKSLILLPDGGVLAAGASSSPAGADKSQGRIGSVDYWAVKLK